MDKGKPARKNHHSFLHLRGVCFYCQIASFHAKSFILCSLVPASSIAFIFIVQFIITDMLFTVFNSTLLVKIIDDTGNE